MSFYTKTRIGSYYNDLLTGDESDFKKLLKRYAIDPVGAVEGYKGKALGKIDVGDGATDATLASMIQATDIKKMGVESNRKVAYVDLQLTGRQQLKPGTSVALGTAEKIAGDRIIFNSTYTPTNNYVPIYYLPWENHHSIRLTIPVKDHRANKAAPLADPDIFFTAAINGCSVIFEGTPQNPTIYHCGGGTGLAEREAAEFWETVVETFMAEEQTKPGNAGRDRGGAIVDSVDKRDYVKQAGVFSTSKLGGIVTKQGTTVRAKSYLSTLKSKHALGRLSIEDVAPWGCVLGRRDAAGDWTFYLQENATVTYHTVERKLTNKFKAVSSTNWSVSRPLSYKEVFPRGSRHVSIQAGLPRII